MKCQTIGLPFLVIDLSCSFSLRVIAFADPSFLVIDLSSSFSLRRIAFAATKGCGCLTILLTSQANHSKQEREVRIEFRLNPMLKPFVAFENSGLVNKLVAP